MSFVAFTRQLDTSGYYGMTTKDVATIRNDDGTLATAPTPIVSDDNADKYNSRKEAVNVAP